MEKQTFIFNAIEDGWTVKKRKGKYYFIKKHGGKTDFFADTFLSEFVVKYISTNKTISVVPDTIF
jgi:hypothetical protein